MAETVDNSKDQCPQPKLRPLDFYVPESSQHAAQVLSVALSEANSIVAPTDDDSIVIAAMAASAICSIFPSLAEPFKAAFTDMGVNLVNSHLSNKYTAEDLVHIRIMPYEEIYVRTGELLILTFKVVDKSDYNSYMSRRVQEMSAKVNASVDENTSALGFVQALDFKFYIGRNASIKKAIIMHTLFLAKNQMNGPWGKICEYVNEIVSWIDLATMLLIFDALVSTNSPVLLEPCVETEVKNLRDAIAAVRRSQHPQFFVVLGDKDEASLLSISRFPILWAVTLRIKNNNVNIPHHRFFLYANRVPSLIVDRLVQLHETAVGTKTLSKIAEKFILEKF